MAKKLCDLKKWLKRDLDSYAELVSDPKYLCVSCGRVANCKKRICDSKAISSRKSEDALLVSSTS